MLFNSISIAPCPGRSRQEIWVQTRICHSIKYPECPGPGACMQQAQFGEIIKDRQTIRANALQLRDAARVSGISDNLLNNAASLGVWHADTANKWDKGREKSESPF